MKVFLDTNILIDLAENRQEAALAAAILQLGEDGQITLYSSYLSFANMGYIWRDVPRQQRYERIRNACVGIEILPMDANQLIQRIATRSKRLRGYASIPMCFSWRLRCDSNEQHEGLPRVLSDAVHVLARLPAAIL